ncbi:MAG: 4Fe-4S binding protein [Dehalococcoidia bacterium]|nr:4Fe-4S binding protein [Dehalococcoidia bacterium]
MAMKITDDCIACGACISECPVEAITDGDTKSIIDPKKCVECKGYAPSSKCVDVCPVEAIVKA